MGREGSWPLCWIRSVSSCFSFFLNPFFWRISVATPSLAFDVLRCAASARVRVQFRTLFSRYDGFNRETSFAAQQQSVFSE
jgi:hypothetical protein